MQLKITNNKEYTFLAKAQSVHNIQSESEMIETYLRLNSESKSSKKILMISHKNITLNLPYSLSKEEW